MSIDESPTLATLCRPTGSDGRRPRAPAGRRHELWQKDVLAQMLQRHAGRKILIADSRPVDRVRLGELLAAACFDIEFADDGADAVTLASDRPPELILMSSQMPVMDGLTAARVLRRLPFARQVPIIAMSDGVLDDEYARFLVAGIDDAVAKPFVADALHRCLLRWLDRRLAFGGSPGWSSYPAARA